VKKKREAKKELVLRAQRGDRDALTELMTEAVPTVSALVRALAPRLRAWEDITQEVMVRAITHLDSRRDPARFGAYLNEITRNLVYDLSRRGRTMGTLAADPPTTAGDPVDRLVRREENARVRRALLELGELDRQVVMLRHWSDATYEEIASALGLTVSAVQSRLFRARRELAKKLRGSGSGDES
jgi:RNA polymerase sigma-70 factor (ECF subfamily)